MYERITSRDDILAAWELVSEEYSRDETVDLATFKRLIFDTYWYFKGSEEFNSVLRADLPIYCHVYWFWKNEDVAWIANYEHYVSYCCADVAEGLTRAIDSGFKRGMKKVMLPLGLTYRNARGELDMSTYEAYDRGFRKQLIFYMREQIEEEEESCDDDVLDEQEELRKIAATKDA